ncbi:MAG: c-type cytochrome, methanol metabolism-related [Rhodospirillales bacterium 20-64-7]|nr:MAG: c-type cytochrome, methanol metabolism-related [Rhodospirillales bacterium 20-64-7]
MAAIAVAVLAFPSGIVAAMADGSGDPAAVKSDSGQWTDKDGNPTFKVEKDGTVDWGTYIGFTRYSAECLRCHGPDGLGSTYAPSLVDALKRLSYSDFYATVAGGKKAVSSSQDLVMPALGQDKNVMCFVNQIYTYLRARSDGAVGRGRPAKHAAKPADYEKSVDDCMG